MKSDVVPRGRFSAESYKRVDFVSRVLLLSQFGTSQSALRNACKNSPVPVLLHIEAANIQNKCLNPLSAVLCLEHTVSFCRVQANPYKICSLLGHRHDDLIPHQSLG